MSAAPEPTKASEIPVILIKPTRGWTSLQLKEVWAYHELLYFLVWRDVKVRYKQTVLGVAWAVLQPVATTVVFTIFFGRLAGIGSDGLPYPLFSFAGLLPWNLFAQGLSQASGSLVGSSNLINKVYFPRLIIPISSVLTGLVDFCVAFFILIGMMAYYHVWPSAGFPPSAFFCAALRGHGARGRAVAVCAQREIPRRPLRRSVLRATLALRHPRDLSREPGNA